MKEENEKCLFKYIKIDRKNEIKFVIDEEDESEMENLELMSTTSSFDEELIGKKMIQFLNEFIPSNTDILKLNLEQNKFFTKLFHRQKDQLKSAVNRLLATDYKDIFIFSPNNITNICRILSKIFKIIKKSDIETGDSFLSKIKKINFANYNFEKLYINQEKIDNLKLNKYKDNNSRQISILTKSKSTFCSSSNSSVVQVSLDDAWDTAEMTENKGIYFIDNRQYYSSTIGDIIKNKLTEECFLYPKDKLNIKSDLPIELIILLYKLKEVKTLIFQIEHIDEIQLKKNIFILINYKWLFPKLNEIKIDLGSDFLQSGINEVFEMRASELYEKFKQNQKRFYYSTDFQARTENLWVPESDIFFEKEENNNNNNKINDLFFNDPVTEDFSNAYGNHICNIYNECGNKTNLKYIEPVKIRKFYDAKYKQIDEIEEYDSENLSIGDSLKLERDSLNPNIFNLNTISEQNSNTIKIEIKQKMKELKKSGQVTTPQILIEFVRDNIYFFKMIIAYGWFVQQMEFLNKLSLFFHDSFSYETELMLRSSDVVYDNFHFLVFTNKLSDLKETNFSFNSLDNKSFENIIGIINKNKKMISLKINFFTPNKNFEQSSLFKLCAAMKISIRNLFREQKINFYHNNNCNNNDIDFYILNHKLLNYFESNIRKLFNLIRKKPILKEIIFRFDLPSLMLLSDKYLIIIIKFLLNIFMYISFEKNKINTLKIFAPDLIFDSKKYPFIKQFFIELLPDEEDLLEKKILEEKEIEEEEKLEKKLLMIREKGRKKKIKEIKKMSSLKLVDENPILRYGANNVDLDGMEEDEILKQLNLLDKEYKSPEKNNNKFKRFISETKQNVCSLDNEKEDEITENIRHYAENEVLKEIILQLKIFNLPEIFNICIINNLNGLQKINISELDEVSFIGFVESYKKNANLMNNLKILKIGIGVSITCFNTKLEETIIDYIKINTPKLEEKFLFSYLEINDEEKMESLVQFIYFKAKIKKLLFQICGNKNILKTIVNHYIEDCRTGMYSLVTLMNKDPFKKLYTVNILECLTSFYSKRKNRVIICKDNPLKFNEEISN